MNQNKKIIIASSSKQVHKKIHQNICTPKQVQLNKYIRASTLDQGHQSKDTKASVSKQIH